MSDSINIRGSITPIVRVRGEVQKSSGTGGAGIIMKTKAEWALIPTLKSIKGCFYVYTDYRQEEDPETHEIINIPAMKLGDGTSYVADLPFTTIPITPEDIERWNNKSNLQATVDEENNRLIFYNL